MNAKTPTPLRPSHPHVIDPDTDARLRALDAARTGTPADPARADAALASILASDPSLPATVTTPSRRPALRWAAAAAGIAAVGTAALALSTAGAPAAYATWTATPSTVLDADVAKVAQACRAQVGTIGGSHGEELPADVPPMTSVSADDLDVRLADRRGDWVFVSLTTTTSDGYSWDAACIAELPAGSSGAPKHLSSVASGGGGLPAPTGQGFTQGSMAEFGATSGLLDTLLGQRDEPASTTNGLVGPEVVGVRIHAGDVSVDASLKDGTYAAWWPGHVIDPDKPLPPSGEGGPEPILTYDLTLKDGTVITDAKPWAPSGELIIESSSSTSTSSSTTTQSFAP
jgi:hypothetical protein